jgi:hypothetical protein
LEQPIDLEAGLNPDLVGLGKGELIADVPGILGSLGSLLLHDVAIKRKASARGDEAALVLHQ